MDDFWLKSQAYIALLFGQNIMFLGTLKVVLENEERRRKLKMDDFWQIMASL